MSGYDQDAGLIKSRLSKIVALINQPCIGPDIEIDGLNLSNRDILASSVLSFCGSPKYLKYAFENPKVKALIVSSDIFNSLSETEKQHFSFILDDYPESTFYQIFKELVRTKYPKYTWKTDLKNAIIYDGAIVENGVILGENVIVGNNSVIKSGSVIGDNVTIGACSVIGGEGFQLVKDKQGRNMTIPHAGRVFIDDDVAIGDNTTVSKSLFEGYTKIGKNTKIDNHVHIAHNCIIADNCVLAANCTLFGSSELKCNVWVAPNVAIMNRVVIGEGAFIGASSFVAKNVKPGSRMFGVPAININK